MLSTSLNIQNSSALDKRPKSLHIINFVNCYPIFIKFASKCRVYKKSFISDAFFANIAFPFKQIQMKADNFN